MYFDTTDVQTGVCTAGELHAYTHTSHDCISSGDTFIIKGNQGATLTTSSYNDFVGWDDTSGAGFTGSISGSIDHDLTDYSAMNHTVGSGSVPGATLDLEDLATNVHVSWSLNSTARTDLVTDDLQVAILSQGDYRNFYNDNMSSDATKMSALYSSDQSGTSVDPYLYLTVDFGQIPRIKMSSGKYTLNSGKLLIK